MLVVMNLMVLVDQLSMDFVVIIGLINFLLLGCCAQIFPDYYQAKKLNDTVKSKIYKDGTASSLTVPSLFFRQCQTPLFSIIRIHSQYLVA